MPDLRELHSAISRFLAEVMAPPSEAAARIDHLRLALDRISPHLTQTGQGGDDWTGYAEDKDGDAPDWDDGCDDAEQNRELMTTYARLYPFLGYYNMPLDVTSRIGESGWGMGAMMDDLVDFTKEMRAAKRLGDLGFQNEMRVMLFTMGVHWEPHLANLRWALAHLHRET